MNTQNQQPDPQSPVFDLYGPQIDADPFPYYKYLRDEFPCYWHERNGIWILSRYEDVLAAAQDWRIFSSSDGNMIDELPGRAGATLGTTDPPRHDRLRALTRVAFGRRNLEQLEAPTRMLAKQALAQIPASRHIDFVTDFASKVTVGILFQLLGLPPQDPADIRRTVVLAISTDKTLRGRNQEQKAAFARLGELILGQVSERRAHPQSDDLISSFASAEVDGDRLTEREIVLTTATFVMAGVESLSSFMSMFALNLHDFPEQRRRLVRERGLMPQAIEESLRLNTSAQRFKRIATRDVALHGMTIHSGERVVLAYGSANRDERKYRDPDSYDIDRRPTGHLGFGAGPHFCLGNTLARLVTAAAMDEFLSAAPEFRLSARELCWISSSNFRSPVALPFDLGSPGG
jgi:cytochrome P450